MTFTVTYRGADGALREERVEAASRAECFAQCRARGIAPLSVKEGNPVSRRGAEARRGKMGGKGLFSRNFTFYILHFTFAIAVVAAMAVVWLWLGRDKAQPSPGPEAPKSKALPKAVKPAAAPKPAPVARRLAAGGGGDARADGVSARETELSAAAGAQFPGIMHTNAAPVARSRFAVSENHAENMIAMLAALPAGRMIVGSPQFDEAFIEDLRRSFETPLKVAEDDSGETAHLKKVVEKIKGDLKAAMDRGEDVAATLTDTFKELQKLGVYRFVLDRELAKLEQTDGVTDTDMDDFVKAANIMLEEKGLEPISLGRIARTILGEGEHADDHAETEDQTEKENAK